MPFPRGAFYATTILKIYYPNLAYNRLFEGGGCVVGGGIIVQVCVFFWGGVKKSSMKA